MPAAMRHDGTGEVFIQIKMNSTGNMVTLVSRLSRCRLPECEADIKKDGLSFPEAKDGFFY
ncbi:hypothetical protein D3C86_2038210 [compost metagenome]